MAKTQFRFSRIVAIKFLSLFMGGVLVLTGILHQFNPEFLNLNHGLGLGFLAVLLPMLLGLLMVIYGVGIWMGFIEGRSEMFYVGIALYALMAVLGLLAYYEGLILTAIGVFVVFGFLNCNQLKRYFGVLK